MGLYITIKGMNDKLKSWVEISQETERQSAFALLDALRVQYNTQKDVIAHLDEIEEKLKLVPRWVQSTVAEILKSNLEKHLAATGLLTAAIMAINPSKIVSDISAANDGSSNESSPRLAA